MSLYGFSNILDAKRRPEFPRGHPRFLELTKLDVTAEWSATGRLSTEHELRLKNNSRFPLTDLSLVITYSAQKRSENIFQSPQRVGHSIEELVPYIPVGGSYSPKLDMQPYFESSKQKHKSQVHGAVRMKSPRQGQITVEIK